MSGATPTPRPNAPSTAGPSRPSSPRPRPSSRISTAPPSSNRPPPDHPFNYITAFSARWHGAYLLFTATYSCLGPNALAPSFETNFARLGYFARDRFNLWARRHNDQWIVIASDLTLDAAFAEMRTNPRFHF